jgi:hypothetical protein
MPTVSLLSSVLCASPVHHERTAMLVDYKFALSGAVRMSVLLNQFTASIDENNRICMCRDCFSLLMCYSVSILNRK